MADGSAVPGERRELVDELGLALRRRLLEAVAPESAIDAAEHADLVASVVEQARTPRLSDRRAGRRRP